MRRRMRMRIPTLWPSWPLTNAQALLAAVATAAVATVIAISGAGREVPSHRRPAT